MAATPSAAQPAAIAPGSAREVIALAEGPRETERERERRERERESESESESDNALLLGRWAARIKLKYLYLKPIY